LNWGDFDVAQQIQLPDCAQKLLDFLYPTVDWTRVRFYSGLPWYVSLFSPNTTGITLPDTVGVSDYCVYLGTATDFCGTGIDTLVHEAFHVAQFMSVSNGYGPGLFRPGFIAYLNCFFANGSVYKNNPFEVQAYAQENAFHACQSIDVCDCSSGSPVFDPAALKALEACNPKLIDREPFAPHCESTLGWAEIVAVLLAMLLTPLAFLAQIFNLFNCRRVSAMRQECVQWAREIRRECAEWADEGYSKCTQWADEGYSKCTKWKDEGYNACTQWRDEGYNKCCDWWPCSWACKALVWIANLVCVVTVWVANLVCIVSVWIANLVCVVSIWIANLVCILYSLVVEIICVAVAWVLYITLFCWW
jgi:hypothetical protein